MRKMLTDSPEEFNGIYIYIYIYIYTMSVCNEKLASYIC